MYGGRLVVADDGYGYVAVPCKCGVIVDRNGRFWGFGVNNEEAFMCNLNVAYENAVGNVAVVVSEVRLDDVIRCWRNI
jgi:hypothetical protein